MTNTIIHEKIKTTIVLIAVATFESVFLIPHFASIDVIPAKNADPNAYNTHIFFSVYASVNSVVRSSKPPFF
jgi:hypothetical protein